jgi:parallel beta-helix repeat protein
MLPAIRRTLTRSWQGCFRYSPGVASAIGKRSAIACAGLLAALCTGCATGETGSHFDVKESGATVGGRVVSDVGGVVEYWVQYGRTTAYGSETAHATVTTQPNVARAVSDIAIGGLTRATTYHYRLCARDAQQHGGPGCGADRTVRTQSFACGETVTTSVRLTGDVFCASAAGLVVGAPGIEVNLAGHSLSGPIFSGSSGPPGILNSAGHADVTIRNGGVGGWGNAIHLEGARGNRIVDVGAAGAAAGVRVQGGEANEIRASQVFGRSGGVLATGTDRLVIAATRAGGAFGPGIRVAGDLASIVRNQVPREGGPFPVTSGIEVSGSGNRIADNRVTGPWSSGSIVLLSGADNLIVENEASGAQGPGMEPPGGRDGDGIHVGAFTAGTLLRDNVAQSNGGDGIEAEATATRLRGNVATSNGDVGIDAVAGVTDLGGNRASSNGNPLQCRNVLCE